MRRDVDSTERAAPPSIPRHGPKLYQAHREVVGIQRAWTPSEVRSAVEAALESPGITYPPSAERIFLLPDLFSDRSALLGGSIDLRLIVAVLEALRDRGFSNLMMGNAPPPAYIRAKIALKERLRLDRICQRYGVRWLDLNHVPTMPVDLPAGRLEVARAAVEAGMIINLPKVRTHPEVGLTLAAFNLKGLLRSEQRPLLTVHPSHNLVALSKAIGPHLNIVDALVIQEGEGPFVGTPAQVGHLFWGRDVMTVDLVVARLFGYTPEEVAHIWVALRESDLAHEAVVDVETHVPVLRDLRRPPSRGAALKSGDMLSTWAQAYVHNRSERPFWRQVALWTRLQVKVDPRGENYHELLRDSNRCGECHRCEAVCPTGLSREDIGRLPVHSSCLECLYCFQVCDRKALTLNGSGDSLAELMVQYHDFLHQLPGP